MHHPSFSGLPDSVIDSMTNVIVSEFVTISARGTPIDTPTLGFMAQGGATIDVATGLAYPVKAERARRNPRVGLWIEGGPDEPVVLIGAMAAVRDANIQDNVRRYLCETIAYFHTYSHGSSWETARQAVFYWSRIIIECTPAIVYWWPNAAALNNPPNIWNAPSAKQFPASDPAPVGTASAAPAWEAQDWGAAADGMLAAQVPAHVSRVAENGFPLPMRLRSIARHESGFVIDLPRGAPFARDGEACLTFQGFATFIGQLQASGTQQLFEVDRMLATLPLVRDSKEIWAPSAATRERLMARLLAELARRSQPLPQIPAEPPPPTEGSLRRAARMAAAAGG